MDLNTIKQQAENSKKAIQEISNQNRIFENLLNSAMKGAPDEHKAEIDKVRLLAKKAINLAKQGKSDEAQNLIKNFNHGGQGN